MTDLVSIVVPVYNVDSYIERCLYSIINQSYEDLEIIIVDDGSTDSSAKLCELIAEKDNRVQYIKKEHEGVVIARNVGIESATGKYMFFIDADDWMEDDHIKNMVEQIKENDVVIAGYTFEPEENEKVAVKKYTPLEEGIYKDEDMRKIWSAMINQDNHYSFPACLWRMLFKTEGIKQIYKQVDKKIFIGEDTVLSNIYLSRCNSAKITNLTGYHYCQRHNEGINRRYSLNGRFENLERAYWCKKKAFEGHICEDILLEGLAYELLFRVKKTAEVYNTTLANVYYYPYYGRWEGKRIVLYGAGNVGKSYKRSIIDENKNKIVLWVDKEKYDNENISKVDEIKHIEYDYIIIAVYDKDLYFEIKRNLMNMGVCEDKILWNQTKVIWEMK